MPEITSMPSMLRSQALALAKSYRHKNYGASVFIRSLKRLAGQQEDKRFLQLKAYLKSPDWDDFDRVNYADFIAFIKLYYPSDLPLYESEILLKDPALPVREVFEALVATQLESKPGAELPKLALTVFEDHAADLDHYPGPLVNPKPAPSAGVQVTLGDMHGNFLKLFYCLIRERVITGIDAEDYSSLVRFYKKTVEELSSEDITFFKSILAKMRASSPSVGLVRLMGDVVCDRGANDGPTLLILARLRELAIPLEIEVSNHDAAFMAAYRPPSDAKATITFSDSHLKEGQDSSMKNLQALLEKFPELSPGIQTAIETHYLASIKLIGYVLDSEMKSITLFTHAPVGLETIRELARYFGVEYKDAKPEELAVTLDQINQKAQGEGIAHLYFLLTNVSELQKLIERRENLVRKICQLTHLSFKNTHTGELEATVEQINQYLESMGTKPLAPKLSKKINKLEATTKKLLVISEKLKTISGKKEEEWGHGHPLYQIIWNRDCRALERPTHFVDADGVSLAEYFFVHAHTSSSDAGLASHVMSLDNKLGKNEGFYNHQGVYQVHYSYKASNPLQPTLTATEAVAPMKSAIVESPGEDPVRPPASLPLVGDSAAEEICSISFKPF